MFSKSQKIYLNNNYIAQKYKNQQTYLQKKSSQIRVDLGAFFGAGYGSRTRLHGLGSRCITDIRILRDGHYSRGKREIQQFFVACGSRTAGKRCRFAQNNAAALLEGKRIG